MLMWSGIEPVTFRTYAVKPTDHQLYLDPHACSRADAARDVVGRGPNLARQAGLEPARFWLTARCSTKLSYCRKIVLDVEEAFNPLRPFNWLLNK